MACVDRPARPRAARVGDTARSPGAAALAASRRKPACEGDGAAIPTTPPRRCSEPSLGDSAACCASTAMLSACVRALGRSRRVYPLYTQHGKVSAAIRELLR
jgi:hypothetical protein